MEGSFVEEHLRASYSDRLFEAKTASGKTLLLYFLIEHKSYADHKVAWQLFRGLYAFMEQKVRENESWQKLPAVVPLLLYHGKERWCFANELLALIDADKAVVPWLVNVRFPVVDLGEIPNPMLAKEARLYAGLLALKYGTRDPEAQMEALEEIILALMEVPDLFVSIVLYLLTTFSCLQEEHVRLIISRVKPQEETEMMSQFAQEILAKNKPEWIAIGRQEGRQEGRLEGRQEGEAQLLMRLLERRFADLPSWAVQKISAADSLTLETWSLRVLEVTTLEEVFADPS